VMILQLAKLVMELLEKVPVVQKSMWNEAATLVYCS